MKGTKGPVIGLTCSDVDRSLPYASMVEKFGGVVKLITPPNVDSVSEAMNNIDGLMLAGGPDVHPKHYGEDSDADCWYNEDRDDPDFQGLLSGHLPLTRQKP